MRGRVSRAGATIRARLRRAGHRLGIDVRRHIPENLDSARLSRLMSHYKIDTVIDVGANEGQYASELRAEGFRGRIISIEPQSQAFERLCAAADADPLWDTVRAGLGSSSGELEINVSADSQSSSFLERNDAVLGAAPVTRYVDVESVPLQMLDELGDELPRDCTPMLKLDVQGYELHVLDGGARFLARVPLLQAELSLAPLYHGAPTYREVIERLEIEGFELAGVEPGYTDPRSGRMLQMDGIFAR